MRSAAALVGLLLLLSGCTTTISGAASPVGATRSAEPPPGSGIVAEPVSSAFPVRGQNLRLVRVGPDRIALQFEFVNGLNRPITPDQLGIDQVERGLLLADLPRSTSYEILDGEGLSGRISASNGDEVPPGGSATITAVFTAPPAETTSLTVIVDGLLPVDVPVQPAGAPALTDDPVLEGAGGPPPGRTLICRADGPADRTGEESVTIRLPADVLFAFGSADLTPAAREAITGAAKEITATRGTVTVEGHTDSVGDDASNQALSERRATAVRGALQGVLSGSFEYRTEGFGERAPVAPNTRPDGTDDPEGRALNRRVELRTGGGERDVTATLAPLTPARDLADAGLAAEVGPLQRRGGYLMAQLRVTNPTQQDIELGPGSGLTPDQSEPTGMTVADRTTQRRYGICHTPSRTQFFYHLGNPSTEFSPDRAGAVPPGATVTFWAFYPPPPAAVSGVDVEVGGFGIVRSTPVPR